jgi:hypothetical protein
LLKEEDKRASRVPDAGVNPCSIGLRDAFTGAAKKGTVTNVSSSVHTRVSQITFTRWSFSALTFA